MKVAFFGSPPAALPTFNRILSDGHEISIVITQPDRPAGRGHTMRYSAVKKTALQHKIPVLQPQKIRTDPDVLKHLKKIQPDVNVVVAYGQIIPGSIIYLPRHHSINLHFSLLPRYRGASPVQWAILNGEKQSGVTVFELDEKMDEGDILTQEKIEIFDSEVAPSLESRMARIGAALISKTLFQIADLKPQKQDPSQVTFAPKIKKEDGQVDWHKNAAHIGRMLKAFSDWPTVYTYFGEKRIKIIEGQSAASRSIETPPGQILAIHKEGIEVACGNEDIFLIQTLQPQNKKVMGAWAFSLGTDIKPGMRMG